MPRVAYKLAKPVKLTAESPEVTELSFRDEVVAGDMRGLKMAGFGEQWDDILKLAGRLCGQTDAVMNLISLHDLAKVSELVAGFLVAGQKIGTEPSQQ